MQEVRAGVAGLCSYREDFSARSDFPMARGQKLDQTLLSLQLPLYEKMMDSCALVFSPLVASGDVYIHNTSKIPASRMPTSFVAAVGGQRYCPAGKAYSFLTGHLHRNLDFMLQKTRCGYAAKPIAIALFYMDIDCGCRATRAVEILMKKTGWKGRSDEIGFYDLYSQFGPGNGKHPTIIDEEIKQINRFDFAIGQCRILSFRNGKELISSTLSIQNQNEQSKGHPAQKNKSRIRPFRPECAHVELSFFVE
jgi:hypothetical protein